MHMGDRTGVKLRSLAGGGLRTARSGILWSSHMDSEITQADPVTKAQTEVSTDSTN